MKFTLADCTERINQILNYPSVHYTDISHYFDQAISELNTSLRIGIKPISYLARLNSFDIHKHPNVILLETKPASNTQLTVVSTKPTDTPTDVGYKYCYDVSINKFWIYQLSAWTQYDKLYAYYTDYSTGEGSSYNAVVLSPNLVVWGKMETNKLTEFNLLDFLPMDWIILFIIPYVCFKYSLRDGSSGSLFAEEFTQGFQQLQTSYDVPNFVTLHEYVHLPAYTEDAKEAITNNTGEVFNVKIPCRAVYDKYKIGAAISSQHDSFYNEGGWGL